jgi:hypothetical protein
VDIDQILRLVERLRREAIGDPNWDGARRVYEYSEHSSKVVAILKLIRAAQGLRALELLRRHGLFLDFGMSMRGVNDAIDEAYFLLEEYPKSSRAVDQFVQAFFESNIDDYLTGETPSVPTKKIRSSRARILSGGHNHETRERLERVFKTFSGYVHANYAHVMEIYGGPTQDFNLGGVPSVEQRRMRAEHVQLAVNSVAYAAAYTAEKLDLVNLRTAILRRVR